MTKEIPFGGMEWVQDTSPEPWEVLAREEEQAARHRRSPGLIPEPTAQVRLGLTPTWTREITRFDPARGDCPVCVAGPTQPGRVCLVCHATAASPVQWPMQLPSSGRAALRARLRGGRGRGVAAKAG